MTIKSPFFIVAAGVLFLMCSADKTGTEKDTPPAGKPESAGETISKLSIGDEAPPFTLPGTPDGAEISLEEALREKPVLLAFYPKAFTSG